MPNGVNDPGGIEAQSRAAFDRYVAEIRRIAAQLNAARANWAFVTRHRDAQGILNNAPGLNTAPVDTVSSGDQPVLATRRGTSLPSSSRD
jgi:hypothetical protein